MKDELWGDDIGYACSDCRFYESEWAGDEDGEKIEVGSCHRLPPIGWNAAQKMPVFATVRSSNWCGEFELTPSNRVRWEAEILDRLNRPSK
jgi:hypothetical protein